MVSPFLHCNRCGAVNRAQAKFCVVCGQPLQGYLPYAQTTSGGSVRQELNEAIDAFKREAVLLAGLMHQNLPRIYDHFTEGGRWYLVMDFIEGETLEVHLSKMPGGHLPLEEVLNIGIQLCTVLDYLHTRQPPIIFRDLKPANVMLTSEGHL